MKKTILLLLASLFLVSCPEEAEIMDLFHSADMTLPVVLDYSLKDNRIFVIEFSETVDMTEILFSGEVLDPPGLGKSFSIPLPYALEPGEEKRISFTVEKDNGSLTRVSLSVIGKNPDIPKVLINEVSIKGTSASPDRIELLIMEKGNVAGMRVEDGNWGYTLPSIEVKKDDLILIYWDKPTARSHYLRSDGKMTYILNAYAPSTLSGTEGLLILKKEKDGETADALLYSDKGETAFSGEEKKSQRDGLIALGQWEGEVFDSSLVTSSRVIARLPGGVDSDTSEDYFITQARKSSFGELNSYLPYNE